MFAERNRNLQSLTPEAIYGQTRQIITKTYREAQKLTSVFDCSHIVLHLKKYKLKFMFAERNQNFQSLTAGSIYGQTIEILYAPCEVMVGCQIDASVRSG